MRRRSTPGRPAASQALASSASLAAWCPASPFSRTASSSVHIKLPIWRCAYAVLFAGFLIVGGRPDGHRTIYPSARMAGNHFDLLFLNLGWVRADTIKKKKS
jgi:hypothetical protein